MHNADLVLGFIGGIGTTELLIFGAILLLLFGATRLPTLMRSMGRSINEFKTGLREPVEPPSVEDREADKTPVSR
jgi:sec-independent protein translocase protein TatA